MIRLAMPGLPLAGSEDRPPAVPSFTAVPRRPRRDATDDDVVVCGSRDPARYPLKPLPPGFERAAHPARADLTLGDAKVGATTQQGMIGGLPSNRVMLSVRIPF